MQLLLTESLELLNEQNVFTSQILGAITYNKATFARGSMCIPYFTSVRADDGRLVPVCLEPESSACMVPHIIFRGRGFCLLPIPENGVQCLCQQRGFQMLLIGQGYLPDDEEVYIFWLLPLKTDGEWSNLCKGYNCMMLYLMGKNCAVRQIPP